MPAIEVEGLSKTYISHKKDPGVKGALKGLFSRQKVEVEAVKHISFTINEGELVGFLGPNGAGKTTTLKMLTGILHPTSGSASVLGFRPFDRKPDMLKQIAFVVGNKQQLWWDLPAWDSFVVLRELYEVPNDVFEKRANEIIDLLQLRDKIHTQVRKLSLGERMKCELAAAFLHGPRVIFLDEPTLGLDVVSQKRIREFLKKLHKDMGCTMILTSHYMQDVQELCDRVVVIDHGALVFDGTLDAMSRGYNDSRQLRLQLGEEVGKERLEEFGKVLSVSEGEAVIEVARDRVASATAAVLQALPVVDIGIEEPPIEDVIAELFTRGREETTPKA